MVKVYILIFVLLLSTFVKAEIDVKQLRCLVCQASLEELDEEIQKIDPKKKIEIGGYRLDDKGNAKMKTVPQAKSEVYLSEMVDKICDKMDDYVRATWKTTGQLTLLRLMDKSGGMNPDMSRVDIIQDGDLNKSLKFYCEGIMEEHEDSIIKHYRNGSDNIDIRVCTDEAGYCSHSMPDSNEHTHEDEL